MKKITTFTLILIFMFGLTSSAMAAGGKVRGDKAEGPAYQHGECPFYG